MGIWGGGGIGMSGGRNVLPTLLTSERGRQTERASERGSENAGGIPD